MNKDVKKVVQGILNFDLSAQDTKITQPCMYNIWLLENKLAPEQFVTSILQRHFHLDQARVSEILSKVAKCGYALCGIYTKDIAETKVSEISKYATENNYQFNSIMMQRSFSYAIKKS
ncbi:ATP-dependent Clp protease adapter protein ClpS [Rickettsiales bacterium]|nr:ATP-dependent Clp protease adapter protein ClpS [Rickettsiales bacterium]